VLHVLRLVGTAEQRTDGKYSLQISGKHLVFQLKTDIAIRAPAEHQLAALLATELDQPGPHSRLYAESIALALTVQLVRNHGADPIKLVPIRGGLRFGSFDEYSTISKRTWPMTFHCRSLRQSSTSRRRTSHASSRGARDCRLIDTNSRFGSSAPRTCYLVICP
jgi:hypothetical protein